MSHTGHWAALLHHVRVRCRGDAMLKWTRCMNVDSVPPIMYITGLATLPRVLISSTRIS